MSASSSLANVGGGVKNLAIGIAVFGAIAAVVYLGFKIKGAVGAVGDALSSAGKAVSDTVDTVRKNSNAYNDALMNPGKYVHADSYLDALLGVSSPAPAQENKSGANDGIPAQPLQGIFGYQPPPSGSVVYRTPESTQPGSKYFLVPIPGADDFG